MITFGFWKKLQKPIFSLAPMADVTDTVFRDVIAKYSRHGQAGGGPDVFWTEFVAADGLAHPDAREKLAVDLRYSETQRPIVAQIFSNDPDNMYEAAKLCRELGFDGIDINMGCPERVIVKQGAGCGLIKTPEIAIEVIKATQRGAGDIPVSVKTRIGFSKNELETWVPALLSANIPALTIHMRTRSDMSKVPAKWELMPDIVRMRDELSPDTLIFGNGDVTDIHHAQQLVEQTGCDGVMLGRAIFGNPWLFASSVCTSCINRTERPASHVPENNTTYENKNNIRSASERVNSSESTGESDATMKPCACGAGMVPTVAGKLHVMLEHTKKYAEELGEHKNFNIMKKHYKAYVNGFPHAKELRIPLMECATYEEIEKLTHDFMAEHPEVLDIVTDKHFDPKY